jgi:hypothetical protein
MPIHAGHPFFKRIINILAVTCTAPASPRRPSASRRGWILYPALALLIAVLPETAYSQQQTFTWQQIRDKFEAANPTLLADKLNVDESRAQEITAFLRPNPTFGLTVDGIEAYGDPSLGLLNLPV